jgi:hypothetical protein
MNKADLLNTKQMAEFASNGFIRFDDVLPLDLCAEIKAIFDANSAAGRGPMGSPLSGIWPEDSPMYRMIYQPRVRGMIESLVGPDSRYDHHAVHKTPGGKLEAQGLHADAEIDVREDAFDIQLSIFVHDTPLEMGGTRFLPGSHFRRVHESQVGRYQHVKGMYQVVCKAGTVVAWHHNLWHGAQPNFTDEMRYMFKLRLNPTVKQQLLWNTDDLDDAGVNGILFHGQPWYGQENRIEQFNRIRLWRFLTNNPTFDTALWYGRVENEPQ